MSGKMMFEIIAIELSGSPKFPPCKVYANFRLKTQNARRFARNWAATSRIGEQA
jgi:hypothetical protein